MLDYIAEINNLITELNYIEEINNLIAELKKYDDAYNEEKPLISDTEYDNLYFKLMNLEKEHNFYLPSSPTQCINYQVVNGLNKKVHKYPMLSLDKTKDWNDFIRYFNSHSVVGMIKLDGLTCCLEYQEGRLVGAETRGNGTKGEDILHNALVVSNIPNRINHTDTLILNGEIISTYSNFENFETEYANPRNFAAGSIRLLDSKECAKRRLMFVAWEIKEGGTNSHIEDLNLLDSLGFTITPWTSGFDLGAKEFLIEKAEEYGYPIDGLVGRFDDKVYGESLGATSHHSRAAYAYKFADETAVAHLTGIEWTMGRTGVLTPVAVFTPIELEGTTVERANLHNISVMKELLHGPGWEDQEVQVFKANMIIPQILSAEDDGNETAKSYFSIPEVCPICGQPTKQVCENTTTVLRCSNNACQGKLINKLDHFCGKKGLDIKGLSKATLEKLIEWKWVEDFTDLFELFHFEEAWSKKPGFGPKSVDNILNAIFYSRYCDLHQYISALGIPLIGSTASKELAKYFKTWDNFIAAIENDFKFYELPNFGYEMHSSLKHFNYTEAKYIVYNYIRFNEIKEDNEDNKSLEGLVFCITGSVHNWKNRDELKSFIEAKGGKVTSSVSKNTNYLINNDATSTSSKNTSAKKFGIPIVTETEFLSLMEK